MNFIKSVTPNRSTLSSSLHYLLLRGNCFSVKSGQFCYLFLYWNYYLSVYRRHYLSVFHDGRQNLAVFALQSPLHTLPIPHILLIIIQQYHGFEREKSSVYIIVPCNDLYE